MTETRADKLARAAQLRADAEKLGEANGILNRHGINRSTYVLTQKHTLEVSAAALEAEAAVPVDEWAAAKRAIEAWEEDTGSFRKHNEVARYVRYLQECLGGHIDAASKFERYASAAGWRDKGATVYDSFINGIATLDAKIAALNAELATKPKELWIGTYRSGGIRHHSESGKPIVFLDYRDAADSINYDAIPYDGRKAGDS